MHTDRIRRVTSNACLLAIVLAIAGCSNKPKAEPLPVPPPIATPQTQPTPIFIPSSVAEMSNQPRTVNLYYASVRGEVNGAIDQSLVPVCRKKAQVDELLKLAVPGKKNEYLSYIVTNCQRVIGGASAKLVKTPEEGDEIVKVSFPNARDVADRQVTGAYYMPAQFLHTKAIVMPGRTSGN